MKIPKFTEEQVLNFLGKLVPDNFGKDKIVNLLGRVEKFLEKYSHKIDFLENVMLFVGMLRSHLDGEFELSRRELGLIVASLLYLLIPTDVVPDVLPLFGLIDDGTAFFLVLKKIGNAVMRYKSKRNRKLLIEQQIQEELETEDMDIDIVEEEK